MIIIILLLLFDYSFRKFKEYHIQIKSSGEGLLIITLTDRTAVLVNIIIVTVALKKKFFSLIDTIVCNYNNNSFVSYLLPLVATLCMCRV